jgi:predicted small lipoprotein YifL
MQANQQCYVRVIAGHEWSIACDPCGKKGTPTYLPDKHGQTHPTETKATHTISGHAIHLVQ